MIRNNNTNRFAKVSIARIIVLNYISLYFSRNIDHEKVVRIGGRSNDPELENISLQTCRKNTKKTPQCRDQIAELYQSIEVAKKEIEKGFNELKEVIANIIFLKRGGNGWKWVVVMGGNGWKRVKMRGNAWKWVVMGRNGWQCVVIGGNG